MLTAKHGCGFLLWPTNSTLPGGAPYSYHVPPELDVLSRFRDAMERAGIGQMLSLLTPADRQKYKLTDTVGVPGRAVGIRNLEAGLNKLEQRLLIAGTQFPSTRKFETVRGVVGMFDECHTPL